MYPSWSLSVTSAPASEPVTLTEAKLHLRVDNSADDNLITSLIQASREYVETATNRALITQTLAKKMAAFPCGQPIWLPKPPLVSISSVSYVDQSGSTQTWAATTGYQLSQPSGANATYARLQPAYGTSYPSTRCQLEAVTITYVAGYGAAAAVPQSIKTAMLMLIGHLYATREAVSPVAMTDVPLSVNALLSPFMVTRW